MYSIKTFAIVGIVALIIIGIIYAEFALPNHSGAVLQGAISIQAVQTSSDGEGRIQPGTPVKLAVVMENKGQKPSAGGQVAIRFAFPKPLDSDPTSQMFQTEKVTVPTIAPGQKVTLSFAKTQQLPSILDFVRDDWSMREYQAILTVDGKDYVVGTLAITISAYYYPGMMKEFPTRVANAN